MKAFKMNYWGQSNLWWLLLCVGILLVIGGFAYWFWPAAGYAVASQIFGWLLVMTGIVQLCVSSGINRPRCWGWWLAGGVIDLFIGFLLVRSVILSESVFPYFLAFIFIFWGISALISGISQRSRKYWWLHMVNGVLSLLIGFFFIEAGYVQDMMMVSFLAALSFIYWGFAISMTAYDMRPVESALKQ